MTFNWLAGLKAKLAPSSRSNPRARRSIQIPSINAALIELLEQRRMLSAGPVIANTETVTKVYTESDPATQITTSLTLTDSNSINISTASVRLFPNFFAGEDVLSFANTGSITGSWDASSGTLTLSGTDTIANYQTALRAVTYQNLSNNPNQAIRRFEFVANDGTSNSPTAYRYFSILPLNGAPVISNVETGASKVIARAPATAISSSLTLTDSGSQTINHATVQLFPNYFPGEDVLSFTNTPSVSGSFDAATGTMTLIGVATAADYQAALRSVMYRDTSNTPNAAIRRFQFVVNDGVSSSATAYRYFSVAASTTPPIISNLETVTFADLEKSPATPITSTVKITDLQSATLQSATIQLAPNYFQGEDLLSFADTATIKGSWNSATGTLTLSGIDSVANYQAALASVTYQNSSNNPHTAIRRFQFNVDDGISKSATAYRYFSIVPLNDAPTIVAPSAQSTIEQVDKTISGLSFADVDAGNAIETVTLGVNQGIVTLATGVSGGLTAGQISGNGTNSVTITAPLAAINATVGAPAGLIYSPAAKYSGGDTLLIGINDNGNTGAGGALSATTTVGITIVPVTPILTQATSTINYTENGPATPIFPTINVVDSINSTLTQATIQISDAINKAYGNQESLQFVPNPATMGNITGAYDTLGGTISGNTLLVLTSAGGTATLAQWQAALQAVSYVNSSEFLHSSQNTASVQVTDGQQSSPKLSSTIVLINVNDAPVVSGPVSITYTNQNTQVVNPTVSLNDPDTDWNSTGFNTLKKVTITMTDYIPVQDVLAVDPLKYNSTLFSVDTTTNPGTVLFTLRTSSTVATLSDWITAIRAVTYNHIGTSNIPSVGVPRHVTYVADDGQSVNNLSAPYTLLLT